MNKERLEEIRERVRQTTPEPWSCIPALDSSGDYGIAVHRAGRVIAECFAEFMSREDKRQAEAEANAEFIAHAREDVTALIGALEEAWAKIYDLEGFFERNAREAGGDGWREEHGKTGE